VELKQINAQGQASAMVIGKLLGSYGADLRAHSPLIATARFARLLKNFSQTAKSKSLLVSPSAAAHQRAVGKSDPFFPLSHKHYLSKGLSAEERLAAATYTYEFIDQRIKPTVLNQVINGGYKIWQFTQNDHTFDLRLMLGNDNIYEGGLSAVFHVDDKRVGVMSFAIVDGIMLGAKPGPAILICRNQTTSDRWYQKPLQDAFKQIALPYMMLACLAGIGRGLNLGAVFAITEEAHPHNLDEQSAKLMSGSYSQFWTKYFSEPCGRGMVRMNIPLETTPLDQVSGNHRRRAKGRREVMENVSAETGTSFTACLIDPPAAKASASDSSVAQTATAALIPTGAALVALAESLAPSHWIQWLNGLT
jgi:uncharacterized protein VirK/YbjX